ncbi:MAG TPA: pentapeptide repeat-containing protein [Ktedonobacterales bacterium]|jgi:uncharacterized protein YjbI with pentapeptide repeats
MSSQDDGPSNRCQPPNGDEREPWRRNWLAQDQPWRSEPEIAPSRQRALAAQRDVPSNVLRGVYTFQQVEPPLTRADVEWLLATHESLGLVGPIDWAEPWQAERSGVDLRGTDLRGLDLSRLPLTGMRGGLVGDHWANASPQLREAAAVRLEGANLREAQLQLAELGGAHLQG